MFLIYLLVISDIYALSVNQFNMYNTDQSRDEFCLFYYEDGSPASPYDSTFEIGNRVKKDPFLLIPYCLLISDESPRFEHFHFPSTFGQSYTFDELKEKNISSEMLLSWSASIDLAERYDLFLKNISDPLALSENESSFYNCTAMLSAGTFIWFGPLCRFGLSHSHNTIIHLAETIHTIMIWNFEVPDVSMIPCYEHLKCRTFNSLCLDWREICNGKVDCLDGEDEFDCWKLEISECHSNEYRCRNGQCIPEQFFNDDSYQPDCLDRTDELPRNEGSITCGLGLNFRCHEQMCRHRDEFPCGNGQCADGLLTCGNKRDQILFDEDCLALLACLTKKKVFYFSTKYCEELSETYRFKHLEENCPTVFAFPLRPILFDHVRLIYTRKALVDNFTDIPLPEYVCYDAELCGNIYPIESTYQNFTCRDFKQFQFDENQSFPNLDRLIEVLKMHFAKCEPLFNETHYCHHSTMYQCLNSTKCISKSRLVDGYGDCPWSDDETYNDSCSLNDINYRMRCVVNNTEKCFASSAIQNFRSDCDSTEDEISGMTFGLNPNGIHFGMICNGYLDLLPLLVDGKTVSDESECQSWSCNNTYSQCDGFWSCKNGADEIGCSSSDCPPFSHQCIFPNETSQVSCLPMSRAGDGIIDCIGGTDELFQDISYIATAAKHYQNYFRCQNDTRLIPFQFTCDFRPHCPLSDDENEDYCNLQSTEPGQALCSYYGINRTEAEEFLCQYNKRYQFQLLVVKFLLKSIPMYSIQTINDLEVFPDKKRMNAQSVETSEVRHSSRAIEATLRKWCYFGIPLHVRMDENRTDLYCLCPPNSYGDQCEYQSERVVLTIQISFASDWTNLFVFLVTLIDNERNIQSYEYIDYSSVRDCDKKFNIFLIYSNRRKNNRSKNYSVQIELLDRMSFAYRSSWIYAILYPFLPVYRLSILLKVPVSNSLIDDRCHTSCIHGQCYAYANDPNSTYCRCDSGWSGMECHTKIDCHCAFDSLCLSNSICVCPLNRHGPRCYLNSSSCYSNPCHNKGQCVSTDLRWTHRYHYEIDVETFQCICPVGYSGELCQNRENLLEQSS